MKKLQRMPEVLALVGFSRSTLFGKVKAGTFPKPVQLSERMIAWREAEVLAWMESLQVAGESNE